MATVVYLDGTETIGSLRARLRHADDSHVVLVVPRGIEGLRDPVYLKLLARAAEQCAVEVALVTRDRQIRERARHQGIPVFSSLERVRRGWLRGRGELRAPGGLPLPREPRVTIAGMLVAIVGGLVVILATLGVGLFVVPSATITLVPAAEALSQTVELTATTKRRSPAPDLGQIPARVVEVRLDMADQTPSSGRRLSPLERASGQVTLANRTNSAVKVAKGSRFGVPGGAQFYTLDEVTLPAPQWSTVRVGVIAAEPGSAGNVPAQAISQVVEPGLVFGVSVLNENPTSGGSDKWVSYVTLEDRNRLKARVVDRIKQEAFPRLLSAKSEAESIYPETATVTILEEIYDRAANEDGDMVALRLRALLRGLAFEGRAANEVAAKVLSTRIPKGTQLLIGSFRTAPLEAYEWDADSVSFRLLVEGKVSPSVDTASIRQAVLGMTAPEAEAYLARNLHLAAKPQVKIQPAWATTVPLLAPRVSVLLSSEARQ